DVYRHPSTRFTASFLGVSNFFSGRVIGNDAGLVRIEVPRGLVLRARANRSAGSEVTLALRPEAVALMPAAPSDSEGSPNKTPAVVEQVIYHGFVSHIYLRLPKGASLIAFRQHGAAADSFLITPGMPVTANWPDDAPQLVREDD